MILLENIKNMRKYFIISILLFFISGLNESCMAISPPGNVVAVGGDKKSFLYWTPAEDAVNYKIYRSNNSEYGFTYIASTITNNYTDQNLLNNKTYYYYIISYDGINASIASTVVKSETISPGLFGYFQFSDFVFYYTPWVSGTDGATVQSSQEIYLNQLATAPGYDFNLSEGMQISSDRKYLLFTESGKIKKISMKDYTIKLVVADNVETLAGLSLSKDNKKIAYVKNFSNKLSLYINDIDGNSEQLLLYNGSDNAYPDFSPDGTKIVFVSSPTNGTPELYEINISTKTINCLTSNSLEEEYPRYSPDGNKISFQAFDETSNSYEIYTISSDGTGLLSITSSSANEYFPAWSPDGSKIAYLSRTDYTNDNGTQYCFHIMAKNSDGTGNASYISNSNNKVIRSGLIWIGKSDVTPPGCIYDLNVTQTGHNSVNLKFTAPGDDCFTGQCTRYEISYSESPITPQSPGTAIEVQVQPQIAGSIEEIVFNHLKSQTLYYFSITAYDEQSNKSEISNIVSVTTEDDSDTSVPNPPANLTANPRNNLRILLYWNHSPSADIAGYKIFRNGTEITAVPYVDNYEDIVPSSSPYIYSVKSFDHKLNQSNAIYSAPVTANDNLYPSAPLWLRSYNLTEGVKLKWEKVELSDISGYEIYRKYNNNSQLIATVSSDSYTDTTGVEGREYIYYLKTKDFAGHRSGLSETVNGTKGLTDNQRVLVIINSNSPDSIDIGEYYASVRNIPQNHLLYLDIPSTYSISMSDYVNKIHNPVKNFIINNNLSTIILFVCLTKGVPVSVSNSCVDNMLADLYNSTADYLPTINEVYQSPHSYLLAKTRFNPQYSMLCVSRLDGPTVELVKSIIDKSIYTEKHPHILSNGKMWIDDRNYNINLYDSYYSFAERFIQTPSVVAKNRGINVQVDGASALFPIDSCTNTQYYYGWYSYWNYKDVFNGYLNIGSIAGHLDSASFYSVNNTGDNNWGIHLLSCGATAVYGAIIEPYTVTFPCGGIFYDRFFKGFNLAESYWCATNTLRWRIMLVGDPLYNPYAMESQQDNQSPAISNITAGACGFRSFMIKWDSDEITEHAVQYYTGSDPFSDTGYKKWFSKNAQVTIDNLSANQTYYFRVKSKDPSGNETISPYESFIYEDIDNDGVEDKWEKTYFGSESASAIEDPDNDGFCNFMEFDLGFNPLIKNSLSIASSSSTTVSWSSEKDRVYKLYYTNNIEWTNTQFIQAGPYRLGTGSTLTWTDDGRNTNLTPQNSSVTKRFYKLTSTPVSR